MKYVDLSIFISNNSIGNPNGNSPKIEYCKTKNEVSVPFERIEMGTHDGTHMDAPWHYYPTMDADLHNGKGIPSDTIDKFPLECGFGDLVVLDYSKMPDGHLLLTSDFEFQLSKLNYKLKKNDILFIKSGAADYWNKDENYYAKGVGVSKEATIWLIEQGIKVVGTDAWSWDRPIPFQVAEFSFTHNKEILWEGHRAGAARGYYQIEKLTNLENVPQTGAKVFCFPIKIYGCSASYTRVVAMFE